MNTYEEKQIEKLANSYTKEKLLTLIDNYKLELKEDKNDTYLNAIQNRLSDLTLALDFKENGRKEKLEDKFISIRKRIRKLIEKYISLKTFFGKDFVSVVINKNYACIKVLDNPNSSEYSSDNILAKITLDLKPRVSFKVNLNGLSDNEFTSILNKVLCNIEKQ